MLRNPFTILHPFADHLTVGMFSKQDDIRGDQAGAEALGVKKAAGLHQVHGNRVIVVHDELKRTEKADGLFTDVKNLALCIRWADCQNFVIFSPKPLVLGVVHVGWRGVEAKTITACFELLKAEWGIAGKDVYVSAGPSLCKNCADFSDPVSELPSVDGRFKDAKHVDLQGAATDEFFRNGVLTGRIERHPDCTRCHPELYWTYRGGHHDEVKAGHTNMVAAVLR